MYAVVANRTKRGAKGLSMNLATTGAKPSDIAKTSGAANLNNKPNATSEVQADGTISLGHGVYDSEDNSI